MKFYFEDLLLVLPVVLCKKKEKKERKEMVVPRQFQSIQIWLLFSAVLARSPGELIILTFNLTFLYC